jgi:hypothetical protein
MEDDEGAGITLNMVSSGVTRAVRGPKRPRVIPKSAKMRLKRLARQDKGTDKHGHAKPSSSGPAAARASDAPLPNSTPRNVVGNSSSSGSGGSSSGGGNSGGVTAAPAAAAAQRGPASSSSAASSASRPSPAAVSSASSAPAASRGVVGSSSSSSSGGGGGGLKTTGPASGTVSESSADGKGGGPRGGNASAPSNGSSKGGSATARGSEAGTQHGRWQPPPKRQIHSSLFDPDMSLDGDKRAAVKGGSSGGSGGGGGGSNPSATVFSAGTPHQLPIDERLARHLEEHMGVVKLTEVQKQAIPVLLRRRDLMVNSATGTGKTLAYAIPVVHDLQQVSPKIKRTDGEKYTSAHMHVLSARQFS